MGVYKCYGKFKKNRKLIKVNIRLFYKMPFNDFLNNLGSKKKLRDLKALAKEIQVIQKKTAIAIEWRRRITKRVSEVLTILKQNPADEKVRQGLVDCLKRERQFVDMVRKGTKSTISILEITLKELRDEKKQQEKKLKKGKDEKLQKEYVEVITELQTIQFLIDAMQFAKEKIKVIEKRIKKGERLEESDYAGKHLNEFLQTLEDEKKIDMELALVLVGKLKKVRGNFNILKYMIKDPGIYIPGLASAAALTGIYYGGTSQINSYYSALGAPPLPDSIPTIAATIIGASVFIMLMLASQTHMFEESRRNFKGEVGGILKIPK